MDVDRNQAGKEPADKIFKCICAHRDRPIPAAELAREVGYSKRQLRRICAGGTGQTPGRLDRRFRMDRAKVLLSEGKMTVKEIAYAVGYKSEQGFCRAFRRDSAASPAEFAKDNPNISPLLPGNLAALGRPFPEGQYEVGVIASDGSITTCAYGNGLIVRVQYPDGHYEPPLKKALVDKRQSTESIYEPLLESRLQESTDCAKPCESPGYNYTFTYAGP